MSTSATKQHILEEIFLLFALILVLHAMINIFRTHLLSLINSVSVWWHVIGVAAIVLVLIFVPDGHQSFSFVFGHRINNSGFAAVRSAAASSGSTSCRSGSC